MQADNISEQDAQSRKLDAEGPIGNQATDKVAARIWVRGHSNCKRVSVNGDA
jgi:hypothetical protein